MPDTRAAPAGIATQAAFDRLQRSRYPHIFLDAVNHLSDSSLSLYALGAGVYASVRLVEAYGLWFARSWAQWLAALSGGLYVPVELVELYRHATGLGLGALLVNLLIVAIMLRSVRLRMAPPKSEV